ncbi:hypothetical protein P8452_50313 [Trifolium repens]|nr:hypothetical protein P8452_50313 [Trifolium repens]
MVHAKKRNLLRQKTHNDVVFVMANAKLAEKKQAGGSVELNLYDDDGDEDEYEDEDEDGDDDLQSLYNVISDLHDQYGNGDEDEYEYGDGDEDGDENQMEDSD